MHSITQPKKKEKRIIQSNAGGKTGREFLQQTGTNNDWHQCMQIDDLSNWSHWLKSLNRCRPSVPNSWLHFVVFRLGAAWSSNGRVGKVHVRRHGIWIDRSILLCVVVVLVVLSRAWRWDAAVWRRRPAHTRHVRTSRDAARPVVGVSRRFKRLRRPISSWMRRHGRSWVAAVAWQRRGCWGRWSARTALLEVSPHMGWDRSVGEVIFTSRTKHI